MAESRMMGEYIQHSSDLVRVCEALDGSEVLFLDTEFESNRGGTLLSLIQVTDGKNAFIIDAVTIADLTPLKGTLAPAGVLWVVHAGKQDVALLMDALQLKSRPDIFDTQVAWSLLGPEYQVSLAYLEAVLLGIRKPKGRQTDNWKRRPLSDEQLSYALGDVTHMPAMYDALIAQLDALNRRPLVLTVSQEVFEPISTPKRTIGLNSYRNLWQLDASQTSALGALVDWYNGFGDSFPSGMPHYKALFSVAARMPETVSELGEIKGINTGFAKRFGDSVIGLLNAHRSAGDGAKTKAAPTPYGDYDEYFRDAWLMCARADISATMSMAPEVAFPPWLMKRLRSLAKTDAPLVEFSREFIGWRSILIPVWQEFCQETQN